MSSNDMTRDNLTESNAYFKSLLDLVPSNVYFDSDSKLKLAADRTKQDGNDPKTLKRIRFDPDAPNTTSDLQKVIPNLPDVDKDDATQFEFDTKFSLLPKEAFEEEDKTKKASRKRKTSTSQENDNKSENVAQPPSPKQVRSQSAKVKSILKESKQKTVENGSESASDERTDQEKSGDTSENEVRTSLNNRRKLNPDQLREKLRVRIEELQKKRQNGMTPEEFLESKKLRRKASKLKLKQKRKEAKKLKVSVEKQKKNSHSKANGVLEVDPNLNKSNNNKLLFSKFQFSEQAKKPKNKEKKPKSYKELYDKVTQEREKIEELKQTNAEKAQKLQEKGAWKKAMEMSKGVKVKDNPELIKKSMKREEKLKQRSQKKWQDRMEAVAESKQKKQDKRMKNIQSRKQAKTDKKIKLAKKKGRLVSGF